MMQIQRIVADQTLVNLHDPRHPRAILEDQPIMAELENTSPETEHKHHYYVGNRIPWYVHLIWVLFWCFAVYYVLRYLFPDIQVHFPSPP